MLLLLNSKPKQTKIVKSILVKQPQKTNENTNAANS